MFARRRPPGRIVLGTVTSIEGHRQSSTAQDRATLRARYLDKTAPIRARSTPRRTP